MNRRGFLSLIFAAPIVALSLRLRPPDSRAIGWTGMDRVVWNGLPLRYDEACPANTIYFISDGAAWRMP